MDILDRTWEMQDRIEKGLMERIRSNKYNRVIKMAVKPTNEEFTKTLQVTFVGMLLIGALGFAIYKIWTGVGELIAPFF